MSIEIKSKEELVEAYRKINLDLTFGVNIQKNQPTAKAVKIVSKATRHFKPEFYFRYENEQRMIESVTKFLEIRMRNLEGREKEKQSRIEARKALVNPYKVGDLLYDSWGYDQTNIDFFMVVEVKPKSVVLRGLGQIMTRSGGFMCEYVKADVNNFIGEPFIRPLKVSRDGSRISVNGHASYRGSLFNYEGGEIYQSHYA